MTSTGSDDSRHSNLQTQETTARIREVVVSDVERIYRFASDERTGTA
jgi:hypothetical protein